MRAMFWEQEVDKVCCGILMLFLYARWDILTRVAFIVVLGLIVLTISCMTDAQRIRESNEAARQSESMRPVPTPTEVPTATPKPKPIPTATPEPVPSATATSIPSAFISAFDIRDGDCLDLKGLSESDDHFELEEVELVSCSEQWEGRVISSFLTKADGNFPGSGFFPMEASSACDRRYHLPIFPTEESWLEGDRSINCVQLSFGLPPGSVSRIDNLLESKALLPSECFLDASDLDEDIIEIVPCDGDWEYRVLNNVGIEEQGNYPTETFLGNLALDRCDRRFSSWYEPTFDSWNQGDRVITCLQERYGIGIDELARLENIVHSSKIRIGECFREYSDFVEIVDCASDWEYKVLHSFEVGSLGDIYPGETFIEDKANKECPDKMDIYEFPLPAHWEAGDRKVACLQQSP